jgi:hypothetical protein
MNQPRNKRFQNVRDALVYMEQNYCDAAIAEKTGLSLENLERLHIVVRQDDGGYRPAAD